MKFRLPNVLKGSGVSPDRIEKLNEELGPEKRAKLPPGQFETKGWPILHYGSVPSFDPKTWDFTVSGLVKRALRLSYEEFRALPTVTMTLDVHCVTRWSKFDMEWEGVPLRIILDRVKPATDANFVIAQCEQGFTANLPVEAIMDDDVLLAYRADGVDLTPDHGWPLRLLVPKRYFWKSAKWLRGLEFRTNDDPGFWERNGYNNNADPWDEERYS